MKIHFRFFLSHVKLAKKARKTQFYRVLLPISLRKTRQRRGVAYDVIDELRRLSLSKCFPALCHKLIYEIAIFHSINRETCDKTYYILLIGIPRNCDDALKPTLDHYLRKGMMQKRDGRDKTEHRACSNIVQHAYGNSSAEIKLFCCHWHQCFQTCMDKIESYYRAMIER